MFTPPGEEGHLGLHSNAALEVHARWGEKVAVHAHTCLFRAMCSGRRPRSCTALCARCCSKDIKVCGLLGPASPLERKGPQVSDQSVGLGGTTAWKLCTLAASTTVAVVFDIGECQRSVRAMRWSAP